MTVAELIEQLSKVEDKHREVKVWLPGERINLSALMIHTIQIGDAAVMVEGCKEADEDITTGR